jgi:SAM-dependent methyltransferase
MYDSFADSFAVHAAHSAYNAHYDRPAVLGLLGNVDGCRVLDVGCGSGLYAAELVQRGADVVGFDNSSKLVERARERVGSGADLRVHDVRDPLDWLGDRTVDRAIMALVLHHLEDPVPALREVHRILKPEGRLVVSTVHPVADWQQLGGSYFTDEMVDDTWNAGWQVRFRRAPLTTWCEEFREAGFLIERLVEPLPSESMKVPFPDTYNKLSAEPFFIVFVLMKASSPADPHD